MNKKEKVPFILELIFDSEERASEWVSRYIDGGGEEATNYIAIYEESDEWDKHTPKYLKLEEASYELED